MASPGIAIAAVGARARAAGAGARMPRFYWDFGTGAEMGREGADAMDARRSASSSACASESAAFCRRDANGRGNATRRSPLGQDAGLERAGLRLVAAPGVRSRTSPPHGFPTASSGRPSTPRCGRRGSSSPAGRVNGRDGSCDSGTWATSAGRPSATRCACSPATLSGVRRSRRPRSGARRPDGPPSSGPWRRREPTPALCPPRCHGLESARAAFKDTSIPRSRRGRTRRRRASSPSRLAADGSLRPARLDQLPAGSRQPDRRGDRRRLGG